MYFVIVDITTMVSESEKLVSTIILCTRGKDLQGEKSTCLPVYLSLCFLTYQSISISYPCKRFVQSETKFCFLLHKNSARKMARKFFFCAATLILNGLGGPGHFKTIFISLKKELCKKEKKFLTLKNSGFLVFFFTRN